MNNELDKPRYHCGCKCIDANGSGTCRDVCGVQFSTSIQAIACPVPRPQEWPALVQVPSAKYRAVRAASHNFRGLPDGSCFKDLSCAATSLFTGQNESIAKSKSVEFLTRSEEFAYFEATISNQNAICRSSEEDTLKFNSREQGRYFKLCFCSLSCMDLSNLSSLSEPLFFENLKVPINRSMFQGTNSIPGPDNYVERGLLSQSPVHLILPLCPVKFNLTVPVTIGDVQNKKGR